MSWNLQEIKTDSIGREIPNNFVYTSANPTCPGAQLSFLFPLAHLTFSQIPASDTFPKDLMMQDNILPLHTHKSASPIASVSPRSDGGGGSGVEEDDLNFHKAPITSVSPQSDGVGGGGAEKDDLNFRKDTLRVFFHDMKLVLKLLPCLRTIISPPCTDDPLGELNSSPRNILEILLNLFLGLCGGLMVLVSVPLLIATPVYMFMLCRGLMILLSWPVNPGSRVMQSDVLGVVAKTGEEWVFVNGICTGKYWLTGNANPFHFICFFGLVVGGFVLTCLEANVNKISSIFQRPVTGIHNRTYGAVYDLFECVLQRCFSQITGDTRATYRYLKGRLMCKEVIKLVVLAHSQGGIILSEALDMLLADVPSENLKKLEIYTFGYAHLFRTTGA